MWANISCRGGRCNGKWRRHKPEYFKGRNFSHQGPGTSDAPKEKIEKEEKDTKTKCNKSAKALEINIKLQIDSEGEKSEWQIKQAWVQLILCYVIITKIMTEIKKFILRPLRATYYIFNLISVWIMDKGLTMANKHKKRHNRSGNNSRRRNISMMEIVAMTTRVKERERSIRIDTDSFSIGINNQASYCISPEIWDFIGPMV